jgi:hypothetical protein
VADATVEAYTEAVDEAVDVNVAVAAAEEEVPHTLGFIVLDRSCGHWILLDLPGTGFWLILLIDRFRSHRSLCTQSPED